MADDDLQPAEQDGAALDRAEKAAEGGMAIADMLSAVNDDSRSVEERQQAIVEGTQVVGSILAAGVRQREQRKQREQQRARNASLEEVEEAPSCECGAQFDRIPVDAERVQCNECGRVYSVSDA